MEKAYDSKLVEDAIYAAWQKSGYFTPENLPNLEARTEAFSIVLPPPNVTGTLHLGHAVMLAIEDAVVRFQRMRGKRALWIPGTDHAAIATQTKVEKILQEEEGKTRHDLGRDEFLGRVRAFAQDSHDTIVDQMKKMGASVDWTREAYTLDDARNTAVNEAFKRMYDDGLIYRGYRIVNWDLVGQTTVSDDEVVHKESKAKLYTFKYSNDFPIAISTTRPETKVGDTAVAVHPEGRWKKFIGKVIVVEDFCGAKLTLKVVGDEAVDDAFGTGALGVTPAHSQIDADIAKRHELEMIQVIGEDGLMTSGAGAVAGKAVKEARKEVVAWLETQGLLESTDEVDQNISVAERTGAVIEPLPKMQWFVDVNKAFAFKKSQHAPMEGIEDGEMVTLKQLMRHVVEKNQVEILPDRFNKTYFHWIDNLRDWNISRQIWFGHRVPVWYRGDEMSVGSAPAGDDWIQDEDTLDTWFSSGLWTFSTLGWPNVEAEDFKRYHPTNLLETGYDILFFWVARMILMSTYLVGEIPFKTVYLHGLVRDDKGRKMSKSLDNIINPLDTIAEYGADATRLSLLIGSSPGNDSKLSVEKIASFRNFTNKLWNISRFVLTSVEKVESVSALPNDLTDADAWILSRLQAVTQEVTEHFEKYELSLLGEKLRAFTWNDFADWYLEVAKIQKRDERRSASTDAVLLYVLEAVLKLWHPFMPFVTEEIYKRFEKDLLMVASWPSFAKATDGTAAIARFDEVCAVITGIRSLRAQYKVAPEKKVEAFISGGEHLQDSAEVISALARLSSLSFDASSENGKSAVFVAGSVSVSLPLAGMVDLAQEKIRLQKSLDEVRKLVASIESKLSNDSFVQNAPAKVIEMEKARLAEARSKEEVLAREITQLD